jgi:uncharacterized membrane-anchored protein YitT (DUF2179 family)
MGLVGGALVGLGCAITFIGGGSTGGLDVITFLLKKYLNISPSLSSFALDGSIILLSLFLLAKPDGSLYSWSEQLIPVLIGILGATACAFVIEIVYVKGSNNYVMEIISPKWEEINRYIQDEVKRGVTIVPVKGGYQNTERVMLKVVFASREYPEIKARVSAIDQDAFVTFTRLARVYGEGFIESKKKQNKKPSKEG